MRLADFAVKSPTIRKGTASPTEKTVNSEAPEAIVPDEPASTRMLARIGPTHGVQPIPNEAPMNAEPKYPVFCFKDWILYSLSRNGIDGKILVQHS